MPETELQIVSGGLTVAKPPEGQMLAVVIGQNGIGGLDIFVPSIKGYHFLYQEYATDPHHEATNVLKEWEKWEIFPDKDPDTGEVYFDPTRNPPDVLEREFGAVMVGPGRSLMIPQLHYPKWEMKRDGNSSEFHLAPKSKETSPYFYYRYFMGVEAVEVETKGTIKISPLVNLVIEMNNPLKAITLSGGWESLLNAAVQGKIRQHFSAMTIEQLQGDTTETLEKARQSLAAEIMELNDDAPPELLAPNGPQPYHSPGLKGHFGITIFAVQFVKFEIVAREKVQNALEAAEVARLNALAAPEIAKRIRKIGNAEASVAAKKAESYGSGQAAASVETAKLYGAAIKKHQGTVVIGGNTPVAVNSDDEKRPRRDQGKR